MTPQTLRQRAEEIAKTTYPGITEAIDAIETALLSVREEAIKECAEIVTDSVIEHSAHGSASAWNECTKTPAELEKEILKLLTPTKEGTNKGGRA